MKAARGLALASVILAALVGIQELLYYLHHRRTGPALELALLAGAVVLLALSSLLNRGR